MIISEKLVERPVFFETPVFMFKSFQRSTSDVPESCVGINLLDAPRGVLQDALRESTGSGDASFRDEPMQIRINSSHKVALWASKLQIRYPKCLGFFDISPRA